MFADVPCAAVKYALVAAATVIGVVALLVSGKVEIFGQERFDAAKWSAQSGADCFDRNDRQQMVDDLTENHLAAGMTTTQVRSLLGQPDTEGPEEDGSLYWDYLTGPDLPDCRTLALLFREGRLYSMHEGQT